MSPPRLFIENEFLLAPTPLRLLGALVEGYSVATKFHRLSFEDPTDLNSDL